MAKQAAPSVTPAPAPAETTASAPLPFLRANAVETSTIDVVKWGNGEELSSTAEPVATETAPAEEAAKPTPSKAKPEAEEAAPEEVTPAETPSAKEKAEGEADTEPVAANAAPNAERRKQIVESLAAERAKRSMEGQIAQEKARADAAEKARADFEALPLARKLAMVAEKHGMSVDDLKDRLLIGAEDVSDAPPAPVKVDPETAALKAKVEALEKRDQAAERAAQQAQIDQAVNLVRTKLEKVDLPMVESLDAYNRVMVVAHEAWAAGGRKGHPADYSDEAGAIVEEELKTERPKMAARLYAKSPALTQEAAEEPEAPKPQPTRLVAGKRTAARPDAKEKSLWENGRTAAEVDAQIKKDLGWA